eukprot:355041-Chlamydomonas_euryale.AAC.10
MALIAWRAIQPRSQLVWEWEPRECTRATGATSDNAACDEQGLTSLSTPGDNLPMWVLPMEIC